jgi:hypothetical protein
MDGNAHVKTQVQVDNLWKYLRDSNNYSEVIDKGLRGWLSKCSSSRARIRVRVRGARMRPRIRVGVRVFDVGWKVGVRG